MTSKDAFYFMMAKKKRDKDAPDDDGPSQKQSKRGVQVDWHICTLCGEGAPLEEPPLRKVTPLE